MRNVIFCFLRVAASVFWLLPSYCTAQINKARYEIPVLASVAGLGRTELQAIVIDQKAYLPVADFFSYLKVKNTVSATGDSITGFFVNATAHYVIDQPRQRIIFNGVTIPLDTVAIVRSQDILYLRADYFGQVFGLSCAFNVRNLSVDVKSAVELPVVRAKRLDAIRRNMIQLKGNTKADTTFKPRKSLLHLGMADWAMTAFQDETGASDFRVNLGLGMRVAGGEGFASLNYNKAASFRVRDQYYLWRYVNNDKKALRQLSLGKVYAPMVSSIWGPVVGVQLTNAPTTFRRSFGTYTISNYTKPGWTVELYVNNILVEYKVANSAGFYSFDVPLVYGSSAVKLRFYGPNGEEVIQQENISVPFNFLPEKTFEYSATAGLVEDKLHSKLAKLNMNYGVSKRMTIGSGVEYLSSLDSNKLMPFANASVLVFKNVLLTADYTHGVRSKGILTYNTPSNLQVELNYTKYVPGQSAVNVSFLEERRLILSKPFGGKNFAFNPRLSLSEIIVPLGKYRTGELMLAGNFFGVSTHISTYVGSNNEASDGALPSIAFSTVSLGFRLPAQFVLTPRIQFDYNQRKLSTVTALLEKRISKKGSVNLSCEQNNVTKTRNYGLGFRYDLSAAQLSLNSLTSRDRYSVQVAARGSLLLDHQSGLVELSNKSGQGRGGIAVTPFIDLNGNGRRDPGERKVHGLKMKINIGRVVPSEKDTNLRVYNLEPYQTYYIEPNLNSFDNVAWRLKKQIIGVSVVPYQFTAVDIPVTPMGEISGSVLLNGDHKRGIGRIIVNVYDQHSNLIVKMLTEEDGYFSYTSLLPGSYTLSLDTKQLSKLGYKAKEASMAFQIKPNEDGDVINKLQFNVAPE